MPINVATIVGLVGVVIAIMVWARTRRVGPVAGVMLGAFVVIAIADRSVLTAGGAAVGDILEWSIENLLNLG